MTIWRFWRAMRRVTQERQWASARVGGALLAFTLPTSAAGLLAATHAQSHRWRPAIATAVANASSPRSLPGCEWLYGAQRALARSTAALTNYVEHQMTLEEKATFVVLHQGDGYENTNGGIPALCVPALNLQDGPNGLGKGMTGVTALPSSLGLAATFDTALAYQYGRVLGEEARGKGLNVVQGPNLNVLRLPESGRAFEGYGEDPTLVSAMGVADIEGIQSTGVMADAKHFTLYSQETARAVVNQVISKRALEEIYLAPFRAAVEEGHVASLMCAYGLVNGTNGCSDPFLYSTLRSWGFTGFVRSDLNAVVSQQQAFMSGLDLVKPSSPAEVLGLVAHHKLSVSTLNSAVHRVLTEMVRFHLLGRAATGSAADRVTSGAHARFALRAAEASMVLLKNSNHILPLLAKSSVAVIGVDAVSDVQSEGGGGAFVASATSKPLYAIADRTPGRRASTSYAPGGPSGAQLPLIPLSDYRSGGPLASTEPHLLPSRSSTTSMSLLAEAGVTPKLATAASPGSGGLWRSWHATVVAPTSGLYDLSLTDSGDCWFSINGSRVLAFPGLHTRSTWTATYQFLAGRAYHLTLQWLDVSRLTPRLGWEDVTPLIAKAARVAAKEKTAVVFVGAPSGEGSDRPNLSLPGDENALISAVAKANPRTVVVLNTGGAVLMPWLHQVSAVLEAWFPGQEDGAATAAILYGKADPSGHLPITFPASEQAVPTDSSSAWPGIGATIDYREGLDVGYRYDEQQRLRPLFPFGFGLSYTSFSLGNASLSQSAANDVVTVTVRNTGPRSGSDVVQGYLSYPRQAAEPALQLRAFGTISLSPGSSGVVHLTLSRQAFESYRNGAFGVASGTFTLHVGTSLAKLPINLRAPVPA